MRDVAKKNAPIPTNVGSVGYKKPPVHSRFKPGQSGNPAGRPAAGLTIKEHLNRMASMSIEEIKNIFLKPGFSAAELVAARVWIHAATLESNSGGVPFAGPEFDRLMDRTIGKPAQSVDVTSGGDALVVKIIKDASMDEL